MSKNSNETEMTEAEMSAKSKHQVQFGIQMPANKLRESVNASIAAGRMSEQDGEVVMWLYGYAQDKGLGWKGLETKMKREVSSATIYGIFMGNYGAADWSGPIRKMREFQRITVEEEKNVDLGFIETATAKMIFTVCDQALNFGKPGFIYGASQLGKTRSLLEYQRRHNHGRTKYIYVGSGWTKSRFVREFAKACKCFATGASTADLEDRIFDSLNRFNLVIIDEFHQALATATEQRAAQIMEFIREVYDRTRCGLVLSATKVGEEMFENGPKAKVYDQLRRRGMVKLTLPDTPPASDIRKIAAAFGLPPPEGAVLEAVKSMLRASGTGMYIKYLQAASTLAGRRGQKLDWEAFASVWDGMRSLAADE